MYHPRNSHCIYIDQKANPKVFEAVNAIVNCYRQIFLQVIQFSSVSWPGPTPKVSDRRLQVDYGVLNMAGPTKKYHKKLPNKTLEPSKYFATSHQLV